VPFPSRCDGPSAFVRRAGVVGWPQFRELVPVPRGRYRCLGGPLERGSARIGQIRVKRLGVGAAEGVGIVGRKTDPASARTKVGAENQPGSRTYPIVSVVMWAGTVGRPRWASAPDVSSLDWVVTRMRAGGHRTHPARTPGNRGGKGHRFRRATRVQDRWGAYPTTGPKVRAARWPAWRASHEKHLDDGPRRAEGFALAVFRSV